MTDLSHRWSLLTSEQKDEWKVKANSGGYWSEQPKKKIIRDLTTAIEENVSAFIVKVRYLLLQSGFYLYGRRRGSFSP